MINTKLEDSIFEQIVASAQVSTKDTFISLFAANKTVLLNNEEQFIKLMNSIHSSQSPDLMEALVKTMGDELLQTIINNRTIMDKIPQKDILNREFLNNVKTKAILIENHKYLKDLLLENKNSIRNILPKNRFDKDFYLAICNNEDLFSTLSPYTQYEFFRQLNPEGILSPPLGNIERTYFATKVGHVLGLSDTQKGYEGSDTKNSLGWLKDFLKDYNNKPDLIGKPEQINFKRIEEAIEFSANLLKRETMLIRDYKYNAEDKLFKRYCDGDLTYIASGWTEHDVSIVLQGDYLLYTNRGQGGDPSFGTRLYKIKDGIKISRDTIADLMRKRNEDELHASLTKIVGDLKKPILGLPSKEQQHGTCSFVNPKASIEGMLVLCDMKAKGHLLSEADLHTYRIKRGPYKAFANFTRDQEVNKIIKFAERATTPGMQNFFAELIGDFLRQHHGRLVRGIDKERQELIRFRKLLEGMPPEIRKKFYETQYDSFMRVQFNPSKNTFAPEYSPHLRKILDQMRPKDRTKDDDDRKVKRTYGKKH